MNFNCLFCKIIAGGMPCDKVHEDEHWLAFHDIKPLAPVHLLIVPKMHLVSLNDLASCPPGGAPLVLAAELARNMRVAERGWRIVVNNGSDAGQEVFHLHFHLLAGKKLGGIG